VVREVEISGLRQIEQKLVENVVRARVGEPYDAGVVEADIVRINTLGRFGGVTAAVAPVDGGVRLIYRLDELPILTGVEVRGNQAIDRFTLLSGVLLRAGDAVDRFLIDQARERIRDAYKASGYFVADVSIDEAALERDRRLVLIVREGPRIRVTRRCASRSRPRPGSRCLARTACWTASSCSSMPRGCRIITKTAVIWWPRWTGRSTCRPTRRMRW